MATLHFISGCYNVPDYTDATEIHLMHQSPPYLISSLCASTPVYFPVSAPPVTRHSVQRMLLRITCVSDNADGIRGEGIKHYPTPLPHHPHHAKPQYRSVEVILSHYLMEAIEFWSLGQSGFIRTK